MTQYRVTTNGKTHHWELIGNKTIEYFKFMEVQFNEFFGNNWYIEFR